MDVTVKMRVDMNEERGMSGGNCGCLRSVNGNFDSHYIIF
jgi:hypothetical protein